MSSKTFSIELVVAAHAIAEHAQAWAAERPGWGAKRFEDLTKEDVNQPDCGDRFRQAVTKLDQALTAEDAWGVVQALIELGHAGRDREVILRSQATSEDAVHAARAPQRKGGEESAKVLTKVKPEDVAYLNDVRPYGAVNAEANKRGVNRSTIYRNRIRGGK